MVQYFINRAGKGLSKDRKKELEKAKRLLQQMMKSKKERDKTSGEGKITPYCTTTKTLSRSPDKRFK